VSLANFIKPDHSALNVNKIALYYNNQCNIDICPRNHAGDCIDSQRGVHLKRM